MATIKTPTITELSQMILDDYTARTSKEPNLLQVSTIKFLAWAFSGVVILLWKYGTWQYLQVWIETADIDALKRWGNLRNISFNTGQTAILNIELTGVTASTIQAGTIWKSIDNGLTYQSTVDTPVSGGVATVSVSASETGTAGNLSDTYILNITNPLTGVPETAQVISTTQTGAEPEDLEVYRTRVLFAYKRPPQGGSASDYYLWVTGVEGIDDCLTYVFTAGRVSLYPIATGSGNSRTATGGIDINPFPTWTDGIEDVVTATGQKLEIYEAIQQADDSTIQNRRPIQVPVEILDPTYIDFEIVISGLTPSTADINDGIKEALISQLDKKKPQIPSLGYTLTDARVNQTKLASVVQETIESYGGGSFTSLILKKDGLSTSQYTLLSGELAVLDRLEINAVEV